MSETSCSYDCTKHPDSVSSYSDISGIGVVIGYLGSSAIVILIVILYYLISFDPAKDPFQKVDRTGDQNSSAQFRENPFDVVFLALMKKIGDIGKAKKLIAPSDPQKKQHNPRLEAAFVKCVLSMSDLQILTGISILISGYVQLRCGLSCYHWQLLVYLAWFSSLTHLSCLTFLRNYLYNNPGERAWRLVSMGILVVMMLVAMVPTGNYDWGSGFDGLGLDTGVRPQPADFAICYFKRAKDVDDATFVSMIISVLLLFLGFLSRVVRLYKSLSVDLGGKLRKTASERLRKHLRKIFNWCDIEHSPNSLKRLLIYRPLLAVVLSLRVLLDAWSSMFVEVFWLISSFLWGILKFVGTYKLIPSGKNEWTFGQVVPVVLLAAPILAISEYLFTDESQSENLHGSTAFPTVQSGTPGTPPPSTPPPSIPSPGILPAGPRSRVSTLQLATSVQSIPPDGVRDDPDFDYSRDSIWYQTFICFVIADIVMSALMTVSLYATGSGKLVEIFIPTALFWEWLPIFDLLCLTLYVLNALLIETIRVGRGPRLTPENRGRIAFGLAVSNFAYLLAAQLPFTPYTLLYVGLGFYIACSLLYRITG